jgi:NAD-dependent SIR2 family protein deacetylase
MENVSDKSPGNTSNCERDLRLLPDDFSRRFSRRSRNLMWLLGAGAAASAGIPTAWDMIWEFKQLLFASQRRVSPRTVADLSNPAVRAQLQAHVDAAAHLPAFGAADEYAALFEAVYPAEADRRSYLDAKMVGAKPSYGHLALATLMRAQLTRLVWTTNFDPLVADACAMVYGTTGPLTTAALETSEMAAQLIGEERWPVEIKLHGDFRSRRLKNTGDELRRQDVRLRQVLVDSCRRLGLVVAGYSGRDASVMDALEEALDHPGAFPAGLFWLHRGEGPPLPRVNQLLTRASTAGVEAALVAIENFDEAMRDLIRLFSGLDTKVLDAFAAERRRWGGAPRPVGPRGWPVVRLNALPIILMPNVCRRVVCHIGGAQEVHEAVERAGVDVLVARTRAGVLAFGADTDIRTAFEPCGITDFGLHTIEIKRLRYDSGERGLLREALTRALACHGGLAYIRQRRTDLLAPTDPLNDAWSPLRKLVGTIAGTVKNHPGLRWREGVGIRLDWADDRLWVLVDPRTVFDGITDECKAAAADFARERAAQRYNRQLNELVAFWADCLACGGVELRALSIGAGIDAVFRISSTNGFSRRVHA